MFAALLSASVMLLSGKIVRSPANHHQSYRWKNVAIVAGGFVDGITYHSSAKGVSYARTDIGGAYRWEPRTNRWVPLLDWLTKADWNLYGIESLAVDANHPDRLLLACGTYTNQWGNNGAILRSEDRGKTFRRADLPFKSGGNEDGRSMGERLAIDPNDGRIIFFGTRNNGLWKSLDGGATWSQVGSFPVRGRTNGIGVTSVAFDRRSGSLGSSSSSIYVGVASHDQNLFHSADGGATWSPVPKAPKNLFVHHLLVSNSGRLFETLSNTSGPNGVTDGAVYSFQPDDAIWHDITPIKPRANGEGGFGYAGLSIDPRDDKTIVVSTLDRWNPGDDVFVTQDGGAHWVGLRAGASLDPSAAPYMTWGAAKPRFGWWIGAVAMDPFNHNRIQYGTGANIWGCDDVKPAKIGKTTHWTVRGTGIEETADIDLLSPPAGAHLITALGDIGGFSHFDLDHPAPGMTLSPLLGNTDSLDSSSRGETLVRVGRPDSGQTAGGVSHNGGATWTPFAKLPDRGVSGGSVATSADGKALIWSPSGHGPSYSNDDGANWLPSSGLMTQAQLTADPVDTKTFFALTGSGDLFVSRNCGVDFQRVAGGGFHHEHGEMRHCFGREGELWIPAGDGLWRSTDGGISFSRLAGVDSADSVGFGKAAAGAQMPAIFMNGKVGGQFGVFRSDDAGVSWILITDRAHEYGTRGVVIGDPRLFGRVYLGTNGRGVLYGDPG